jgi:hypothetical protein
VFAATESPTIPLALPLWPDTIVSQAALLEADHEQPVSVVSATDSGPPAALISSRAWFKLNVHGAPAWLNDAFSDPTAIDPERGDGTGLGATENGITAAPCPSRAPVIDTHAASAPTDHVQSREVEIVAEPAPPAAVNEEGVLVTETAHLSAVGATTEEEVVDEVQPDRRMPPSASAAAGRDRRKPSSFIQDEPDARASPARSG